MGENVQTTLRLLDTVGVYVFVVVFLTKLSVGVCVELADIVPEPVVVFEILDVTVCVGELVCVFDPRELAV